MTKGRKPQPIGIRVLRGNPSRRPFNTQAPQYRALDTATPEELTDEIARAEWDRLAPLLVASGHVTVVDRSTFIAYCQKYADWRRLETAANAAPLTTKTPKSGYEVANPLRGMANRSFVLMMRAASELGITPSARSRVIAAPFAPHETKWPELVSS